MYSDNENDKEYDNEYEYDSQYDYSNCDEMSISEAFDIRNGVTMCVVKKHNMMPTVQIVDPGFHRVKQMIHGVKTKIGFYHTTNIPGRMIRNAITGIRYDDYHVGRCDEDIFYKVSYAVGETSRSESCILFFDSPEQFEKHFGLTVRLETKEKWRNKCNAELLRRRKKEEKTI
jgi:hypothetical protein